MFQGCQIVIKVLKYLLSIFVLSSHYRLLSLQTGTSWQATLCISLFSMTLGLSNLSSSLSQPEGAISPLVTSLRVPASAPVETKLFSNHLFWVILFPLMDTIFLKIQNSQYFYDISNKSPHAPHDWPRHTGLWTPQGTGVAADLHTSIKSTIFHSIIWAL